MSLEDYQGFLHKIPQQLQGKVKEVSNHTLVAKRHLATPASNVFANGDKDASVANQYYDEACYSLFVQAALGALAESEVAPHEITAIVSISCTGVAMPALTSRLIEHLGFNPYVKHVPVSQWGCAGGVAALKLADLFCRANPQETVLVLCAEVCSSMYHGEMDMASMVCASLFADAASGCIVLGMQSPVLERVGGNPVLFMERSHEYIIPQSEHWMRYTMDSRGIHFRLAKEVGASMAVAGPIVTQFLEDCNQVIQDPDLTLIAHTGGPKILRELLHLLYPASIIAPESEDKIQDYTSRQLLSSEGPRVRASLDVLRNFGNIASVTIFVSLRDTLASKQASAAAASRSPVLVLGCGPGMGVQQLYGHIAPVHAEVPASPLTSIAVATILPPYQSKTTTFDAAVIGASLADKALALALRSQGKSVAIINQEPGTPVESDHSIESELASLLPFVDIRSHVGSLFEQSGHSVVKSDREGSVTSLTDFRFISQKESAGVGSGETDESKRDLFRITAQYSATGTLHEIRAHRVIKAADALAVLKAIIASGIPSTFALPVSTSLPSQPRPVSPQASSVSVSLAQV